MMLLKLISAELLQKLIILDQHFQVDSSTGRNPNSPSSPGKHVKNSTSSANEAEKLQKFVSLDKSKGSSSFTKSTSGANQTELLENIVVLDRLQDGRSVRINSTIANLRKQIISISQDKQCHRKSR